MRTRRLAILLFLPIAAGCNAPASQGGDGGGPGPGQDLAGRDLRGVDLAGVDLAGVAAQDLAAPADGPAAADLAQPGPAVRFAAMGDTGKANQGQSDVAKAVAMKCAKDGCDFVQLLGDNIYDSGVDSVNDPQWQTKFEGPYSVVNLPFYAVLGNHDYGGNGTGNEFGKGQHQVDYSMKSMKWKMPAAHYHWTSGAVEFFALDTNLQMYYRDAGQRTDVKGWLGASTATWKIAFGHHPYRSNGPHGNAGSYDNVPFVPIANGAGVKGFMEDVVCGKVDLYICGHDHSRQWLKPTCGGTELVVSGAGASATKLEGSNPFHFQSLALGFLYVVIQGNTLTGEWIDVNGAVESSRTLTK